MSAHPTREHRATDPVWALYDRHTELRAVIDAVLEGHAGEIHFVADQAPTAAVLRVGCYHILGGEAQSPAAEILVREADRPTEMVYAGEPWRRLIVAIHGERATPDPMQGFDASVLDKVALARLSDKVPAGFDLRRMTLADVEGLGPELSPHGMQVYDSAEAFMNRGVGYVAVKGDQLACVASSYGASAERVEVAISTAEPWRGRGLATVTAARLLLHCLERGITPEWNAANPVSQRLAERLGYRAAGTVTILRLSALASDA